MMTHAIGIDFGTTNSTVAIADQHGRVENISWPSAEGPSEVFRTALTFWSEGRMPKATLRHVGGPDALQRALSPDGHHRFVQSIKTYVATASFTETRLFGKRFTIEALIATFLNHLLAQDRDRVITPNVPIVGGRPVVFAGGRPDEALAVKRLQSAYAEAGLPQVDLAYEPLGAAYWYARNLKRDETVLVADFGGGTSDFSVIRFTRDSAGRLEGTPLAHSGVGVAGDTFDYRLVDHLVSPQLGKNSHYRSFDKLLPFPAYVHAAFAQWHQLSWLKTSKVMAELKSLAASSEVPERIEALMTFLDMDLGFELYRAISAVKMRLSSEEQAELDFNSGGVTLRAKVTRRDFERFIAPDLARISAATDEAMVASGLGTDDIDAVFMTGGTSYVPAVRRLFEDRFGPERLHTGNAFQSVASGLALLAADRARR
ncbi:Hsp70 family protein [Lichenihabitans sp. PAMC28606]|uniref:Hsp70 family protein n=1 Tax=Lichenihabitans sp. PAMC28606 TaxID=2880932 RepID=UPI001D0BA007|nr:Hsp70 family protein [Lichenihabitans sp. PAMC28606]UDL93650.1 Hsp70 family protein [Lichenihabitans sp. PAMC28606]